MQSLAQTSLRFCPVLRRIRFSSEIQSSRSKSALSILKEGIPAKPKRPGNSYIQFVKEVSPKMIADNPSASRNEIIKMASEMWKNADEKMKEQYETIFKEMRTKYQKTLQSYNDNLTDEQKLAIATISEADLRRKKKSKIKKTLTELGKPKKSSSAFGLFLSEIDCKARPDETNTERLKRLSKAWQTLPEAEREKYFARATDLRNEYFTRLEEWEAKMLSTINIDHESDKVGADENKSKTASKSKKTPMSHYFSKLFEKHAKK